MTSDTLLVSDTVFQLNVLLWALEDLPNSTDIQPVLREAGYELESLGRRLLVPSGDKAVSVLRELAGTADLSPCHPDLCIINQNHPVTLVVELKSHGFGGKSSNTRQAVKLIVASHDLSESYAETQPRPGHVVYATVKHDAAQLEKTLQDLSESIKSKGVPAAPTDTIGISIDDEGVRLSISSLSNLPTPAQEALQEPVVVLHRRDADDIRPLYLIPWIPGLQANQDSELQADGYRELTARIIVQALAVVGQASAPTTLEITGATMLSRATFGVFDRWLDTDRQKFSEAAIGVLTKTLTSLSGFQKKSRDVVSLSFSSQEEQAEVIKLLEQVSPADTSTNIQAAVNAPQKLFDDY